MAKLEQIQQFLRDYLQPERFNDSSANGLQIAGKEDIQTVAVAVDAAIATAEKAVAAGADMLFVHHGVFWGHSMPIVGAHYKFVKTLLDHGTSLIAMHLPLDGHLVSGNNALLAKLLNLEQVVAAFESGNVCIGVIAENRSALSRLTMVEKLQSLPGAALTVLPFGPEIPRRVGIVSGAAADLARVCPSNGIDTFITGEPKQFVYHFAKEHSLNVICAGHYATETVGVRAIGELLQERFAVRSIFIDEPTGI